MIIESLHIYGYGKIVDKELVFNSQLHAIYGKNEAGKSTIMSFIHSVLFGFPLRNQQENRYEPKFGYKYGGKLTIRTELDELLMIERVAGKAAGEVTVYFSDGSVGGEAELQEIVGGMDKKLFTSIFSFGLKGLQNIQSLNGDELSHYLLSTSILGSDQIIELEKKLNKDMELLFKPGGKRPEINQELEEMNHLAQKVSQKKSQILDYQAFLTKERKLETDLAELKEELESITALNKKLEVFEQYLPLRSELMVIEANMTNIGDRPVFPMDGVKKLEQLTERVMLLQAKVSGIKKKKEEYQKIHSSLAIREDLLTCEEEMKHYSLHWTKMDLLKKTLVEYNSKVTHMEEKLTSIKKSLRISIDDEEVENLPLSLSMKNELKTIVSDYSILKNKRELLEQQQELLKEKIELAEVRHEQYKGQLLDDEQRETYSTIVRDQVNKQAKDQHVQFIKLTHERITKQIEEQKKRIKSTDFIKTGVMFPLAMLMSVFGVWQLLTVSKMTGIIFIILGILLGIGGALIKKLMGSQHVLTLLKQELSEIEHQLHSSMTSECDRDWIDAEQLLAKDDQIRLLVYKEAMMLQQLEQEYERTIQQFEKWEQSHYSVSAKMQQVKGKLKIPEAYSVQVLLEFYEQLETLAKIIEEKQKLRDEQDKLEQEIRSFTNNYDSLIQRLQISKTVSPNQLLEIIEEEKRKQLEKNKLDEKAKELEEELLQQIDEINYFNEQINQLYQAAEVESEEEFRKQARLLDEWVELQDRFKKVSEHIKILLNHKVDLEQELLDQMETLSIQLGNKEQITARFETLCQKEKDMLSELAEVNILKKQLEEEGTYSLLLHQFEMKKALLDEKAKHWAKLAIAKDVLQRTKDYYSMVRLPQVLQKAEHFFHLLTNKEYSRIFLHESQAILVEREDGIRYFPGELSQATSEQLYLAIRLSLAYYYQTSIQFPIIIDDSFVNFDENRYKLTMDVLQELSTKRQILFFTCHNHALHCLNVEDNAVTFLDQQLANKA